MVQTIQKMESMMNPAHENHSLTSLLPSGFDVEAFLKFAFDPFDTQAVLNVQKALLTSPQRSEMIQWTYQSITSDTNFMQLFAELYNPRFPTNEELIQYPLGSLGYAIGTHLIKNNITLDFAGLDTSMFFSQDVNVTTYFSSRALRLHDFFHVVLGLGVTPLEEYAVACFNLGQFRSPYHMLQVSAGALYIAFQRPDQIPQFLELNQRFFHLGRSCLFLTGFRFEEHLQTPLSEVRNLLKLPQI